MPDVYWSSETSSGASNAQSLLSDADYVHVLLLSSQGLHMEQPAATQAAAAKGKK